jgi:hypothetical protein
MTLRIDRLDELVEVMTAAAASIDLEAMVPAGWRPALTVARLSGRDPVQLARQALTTSMQRLPSLARSDPEAADGWLRSAVHVVAWLDGQTDVPPAILAAAPSPSDADPGP